MERRRLLRAFGVAFGVAVAVGNTIGGGILRTPGQIASYLPDALLFMGVWVLGGLYALLGAISLAELGAMIPRSGGQTVFVRRALGGYPGFAVGWSDWISTCTSTAFIAIVVGEYTVSLVPGLTPFATLVAAAAALFFALLHSGGVRIAGQTQILTSAVKALAFLLLIAACFLLRDSRAPEAAPIAAPAFGLALVLALQAVIYTYDGWTGPIYFSEEVHDPARDIPRSMAGGVLAVALVYLLTNAAFLYVLPMSAMAGEELVAARAAEQLFGEPGDLIIRVLTIVSMLSAINALTLMAPRVLYALAQDGLVPFAERVDRKGTPTFGLWASTAVAVLTIATGTVETVIALAAFFFVANYTLSFISVFVLRRREPETPRPYRAWGYPWTTGIVLLGSIAFLVGAVVTDTRNALYSVAVLALSFPVFHLLKRVARPRSPDPRAT